MSLYKTAFLNQMQDFLDDLEYSFPQETHIRTAKLFFQALKTSMPDKILDQFVEYVGPYQTQIEQRDEHFFLEDSLNVDDNYMAQAVQLKNVWRTASDKNKLCIWEYMTNLVKLAKLAKRV